MQINPVLIPSCKAATATITSEKTNMGSGNIQLNSIDSNTNQLSLSNNGIKIGKGIHTILVSGGVFGYGISTSTNPYLWTSIDKNNTNNQISISLAAQSQGYASTIHAPRKVSVKEGDIIYLHKIVANPACNLRAGANTWLTVQVLD